MATASTRKQLAASSQSSFKMVVIGETGSGKTSVLQLLLNYAKQFHLEDYSMDQVTSFIKTERKEPTKRKEKWESDTTESKKYTAQYDDFTLDVIDTPGFCDTRGGDQDKANIANIIALVKKELYINCVCLIINGTEVRLTTVMKEVITQIVSILPPNILRNIIVIFTKVRDELSLKFDVAMLKEFQLFIPKNHFFTIDNPYSRYESLPPKPDKKQVRKLKQDFKDAHETLDEMFEVIKKLKPEMTLKFGEFQEAVDDINACFTKLKAHYRNTEQVQKLIESPDTYEGGMDKVTYERTLTKDSENKNVVCEVCFSNCHEKCECWFTFIFISMCNRFSRRLHCKECGHSSVKHKRIKIYYEKVMEEVDLKDLTPGDRKKVLKKKLSEHEADIDKETQNLESKITKFQSVGSIFIFSKNAIEQIEVLRKEMESIPNYKHRDKISTIFRETKDVINDPTTAKNDKIKARWACGVLGLEDPDKLTEEEISKFFRKQAGQVHPDATSDESTSTAFKHLNYAKDFLKRSFFGGSK